MTTLVIKTNVSQATDVLIKDLGFLIPNSGGNVTFTDLPNLQDCNTSVNLRTLATDDAFGAGSSTLILNNGTSDIAQANVDTFLNQIAGVQGDTGILGITGVRGLTGILGIGGQTGVQGLQGITGSQGATGTQGITGIQGSTGIIGITGFQGITGVQGPTGFGVQGTTGFVGTTGLVGITGVIGLTGIQGATGTQGPTGTQGITGFIGITGIVFNSQIIGNTGNATTTSTGYQAFATTGLSTALIPSAGSYVVIFSSSVSQSANANMVFVALFSNGTEIVNTVRSWMRGTGASTGVVNTQALVTVTGTEIVDMRWRVSTGTGTMNQRSLTFIRTTV